MLKLAKKIKQNAKQHHQAKLLLFENCSHSSFTLSSKNNRNILRKKPKSKCVCIHEIIQLTIMKMKMKMKNRFI